MNQRHLSLYRQANAIPISKILDHFKVKYDKSFAYLISCPIPSHIHQSGTPSFKVYKDTNSFYCFGCKATGGPAHLTQKMLGVKTLEEALDYLAKHFDLKAKSLATSFLKSTKSIKARSSTLTPELVVAEKDRKFNILSSKYRSFSRSVEIVSFYEALYYSKQLYLNNLIDREIFESYCEDLFTRFELFILALSSCAKKDCATDVENLLDLITKL